MINDSVEKVNAGGKLVDQAGVTMADIVMSITSVTDIMSEIASASAEQTMGIDQINSAISQKDELTQKNAALVEEAAAAAGSMQEQAASLSEVVSIFKVGQVVAGRYSNSLQSEARVAVIRMPVPRRAAAKGPTCAP